MSTWFHQGLAAQHSVWKDGVKAVKNYRSEFNFSHQTQDMYRFLISLRWSDKANTLKMDLCLNLLDCPGTQSVQAGKSSACQGCPNQKLCSSGAARAPDPGKSVIIWSFHIYSKRLDSSSDSYSSWIKFKKEKDKSVALSRTIFLVDPYFLYFLLSHHKPSASFISSPMSYLQL